MKYFLPSVNVAVLVYVFINPAVTLPAALVLVASLAHTYLLPKDSQPAPAFPSERFDKIEKQVREMAITRMVK